MNIIDTHIHIWNFSRASYSWLEGNATILNRNYLIEELDPQRKAAGVTEGVLVQAANTIAETEYMLEVAAKTTWLTGVVGWLPLERPDDVASLLSSGYATHPLFRGVRHLIHDEPDAKWLLQPTVLQSLQSLADAGIPYDVVGVLPAHLETVLEVLNKVPELTIVLDHLNQPPIQQGEKFGQWGELVSEVAGFPKAYGKISGLGTTTARGDSWGVDDVKPYVAFALEKFGPDRCFCGGDWPVSLLAGSYGHAWDVYKQTVDSLLQKDDAEKVLYHNAQQFYNL
jgi:L-fuconolactonase